MVMFSHMDGPRDYHTKWGKSNRERQIYDITYMLHLKYIYIYVLIYKTKTDSQTSKTNMVTKGETWGGEG